MEHGHWNHAWSQEYAYLTTLTFVQLFVFLYIQLLGSVSAFTKFVDATTVYNMSNLSYVKFLTTN